MKRACAIALAGALIVGCERTHETTFSITFPSVNAAVATDTVETQVYSVAREDACEDIFERRRTDQALPAPIVSTGSRRVCELFGETAPALDVGFGLRAFLVVAKRSGAPLLMGCEVSYVDDRTPPPVVRLTLFDSTKPVPETACKSLADRCAGACN